MEYDYIIIDDLSRLRVLDLIDRLRDGWRISLVTTTRSAIHYLVERETPKPPTPDLSADVTPIEPAIEDLDDQPINLDDIKW